MLEGLFAFFCLVVVILGMKVIYDAFFALMWKLLCKEIRNGEIKQDIFADLEKIRSNMPNIY
jgi:hypothetical protein